MPLNWSLELGKYAYLLKKLKVVSHHSKREQSFLLGMLLSTILPFRLGETFGRISRFSKLRESLKVAVATIYGSILLNFVLLFGAATAFYIFPNLISEYTNKLDFPFQFSWLYYLIPVLLLFGLLVYLKNKNIWFNAAKSLLNTLDLSVFINALLLSILRYAVFVFQFVCILLIANHEAEVSNLIGLTAIYFGLLTIAPALTISKVGIREALAFMVFAPLNIGFEAAISSSLLWLINLLLPSLLAFIYFIGLNISSFRILKFYARRK